MRSKTPQLGPLGTYTAKRDSLLSEITQALAADNRFAAAWLGGSFGRGEADEISDLDLTVVVMDDYCTTLCARSERTGGKVPPERLALIRRFGQPSVLHENHHNAPEGGTFTFVLYASSAVMVDWTLVPLSKARRPLASKLLFDKAGVPQEAPLIPGNPHQFAASTVDRVAFFWMMAAVTCKYILREDAVKVQWMLDMLHHTIRETEQILKGETMPYWSGSLAELAPTRASQASAVRQLIQRMIDLMPSIEKMGVQLPPAPLDEIESLLNMPSS